MPIPTRAHCAFLAGLILLAGPAAAQTSPPASMIPPNPVAAPAVDPQVTALFQQTIAAHKALTALTATIAVISTARGLIGNTEQTIMLAYQKPRQARVAVADKDGPIVEFVSNGNSVTLYSAHSKNYRVYPVPAETDVIPKVFESSRSLVANLFGQPQALSSLLAQPGVTATLGTSSTIEVVPTDTVVVTLPNPTGKINFTIDIGKTDHFLRRITETQSFTASDGKINTEKHIETVTALSATPTFTAADFVFTPPPGVKKMAVPKAAQSQPMHDPRLVPGAKPFSVTAKDLNGRPLSLAQYHGKVVLMDFWATWCGPCVGEMPNVIAAYKKYHAQGFDIVGVSLDESRPALTSFIAQNKMPWRQVFDGKQWSSAVPREYGVMSIPFGLLVGRDGKIAAVDVRGPALETAIQQALAK